MRATDLHRLHLLWENITVLWFHGPCLEYHFNHFFTWVPHPCHSVWSALAAWCDLCCLYILIILQRISLPSPACLLGVLIRQISWGSLDRSGSEYITGNKNLFKWGLLSPFSCWGNNSNKACYRNICPYIHEICDNAECCQMPAGCRDSHQ